MWINRGRVWQQLKTEDYFPEPMGIQGLLKLTGSIRDNWNKALRTEVNTAIKMSVFSNNKTPMPGEKVIPIKTIFKTKLNEDGEIDKLKCRCAVRGDLQKKYGNPLSNESTWVLTATFRVLRRFLAEAAKYNATIRQIDYVAAFCQGKMRGRVFVKFDEIFKQLIPEQAQYFGVPLKLERGIYGMTHSGKFFDEDLCDYLLHTLNFTQSDHEPGLLILRKNTGWIFLLNYIDDELFFASNETLNNWYSLNKCQ